MFNFERKKFAHLLSQLCIFVFTFMIKSFHIYEALLHVRLKVLTFTRLITFSHLRVRQVVLWKSFLSLHDFWVKKCNNHFLK